MAKGTITDISAYVIRLSPYKDNDAMVTVLSESGLQSFLARGILKPTSKNAAACQLLAFSDFSLAAGKNGGLSLSEARCRLPIDGKDDFERLTAFSFLAELSAKMIQNDEAVPLFPWLKAALDAIDSGFDPFSAALVYLAHVLLTAGYGLDVDECVYCGSKKDIAGISYADGGFVCRNDLQEGVQEASARKLKILRYLFRCQLSDLSRVAFEKEECQGLFRELALYLNDLTGVELKSVALIEKV
jgi:DNA repair protein RecO (recombination protein O)